jgi:methylthioribose-1-phosphate isomerase
MKPVYWEDDKLKLVDQLALPTELIIHSYTDYREVAAAIKNMIVRGAPAIGVTAGYGYYLGAKEYQGLDRDIFIRNMDEVTKTLAETRPTAVNLFWALKQMAEVITDNPDMTVKELIPALFSKAEEICEDDIQMCRNIGRFGADLVHDGDTFLTHCNAGALATADYGTALGVIRGAVDAGKKVKVYADETRPFLQGARLTAWELQHDGIDVTLITDNMAGWMMHCGKIDGVVVGADRIASNGDVANKIGTYSVAILAKEHGIPFYVAAPTSTFDFQITSGEEIPIEERSHQEVCFIKEVQIAPDGIKVEHPGFDVTPHKYITAIVTEKGIVYPPFDLNIEKLLKE